MRSLPTLAYRMQAHCANARKIAAYLHEHPKVSVVHYPGLPNNPYHALAARQMSDFGGMLSFEVAGGKDATLSIPRYAYIPCGFIDRKDLDADDIGQ